MKKRRKRNNKKKILSGLLLLVILSIISLLIIFKDKIETYIYLYKYDYSKETISVLKDNNILSKILSKKYSKTLDEMVNSEYFNNKYIDDYIAIDYQENNDFLKNINILLDLGYNDNDINNIYTKLNDENINLLINNNYIKDISNILKLNYFKDNLLERYIKYYLNNEYSYEDAITYVNIGLDNDYYTNVINLTDRDNIEVLVNKYNNLGSDYVPSDLVDVKPQYRTKANKLKKVANEYFEKMADAAKKDNIYIYASSCYRSYTTQKNLYNYYVSIDGKKAADTYSARAGYSEHQTGLAIDIAGENKDFIEDNTKEFNWLINNSYKYGYILRYVKGKEKITGYMYEPWHYRYVGEDIATYIHENNLTYDEYMARK